MYVVMWKTEIRVAHTHEFSCAPSERTGTRSCVVRELVLTLISRVGREGNADPREREAGKGEDGPSEGDWSPSSGRAPSVASDHLPRSGEKRGEGTLFKTNRSSRLGG